MKFLRSKFRTFALFAMLAVMAMPAAFASADGGSSAPTLDIDMSSLFDQINYWAGVLFPVISIGFAIMIAIAIIRFVGNSIVSAFRGG